MRELSQEELGVGGRSTALSRRQLLIVGGSLASGVALGGCTPSPAPPQPKPGSATSDTPVPGRLPFPKGFRFGVATSAYQIEGAATADGRGPSIWDTFCATPGKIDDGSSGAVACDHYRRWSGDLDLLTQLGVQSYRFSIAWPRVLPTGRGKLNQAGLAFYQRLLAGLRERGIAPVATLYHWDLPQALQDQGGWENRDSASWFGDYAAAMFDRLGGVDTWLTINEPKIITQQGYQLGWMAPGKQDPTAAGKVVHHLGLAHGRAVQAFRASEQPGTIGPCAVVTPCYPADDTAEAGRAAAVADVRENTLYLDPILRGRYPALEDALPPAMATALDKATKTGDLNLINQPVDLLAVNYYSPAVIDGSGQMTMRYPVSSSGWQQIHPDGLYDTLRRLQTDYQLPMIIAENGVPGDIADTSPNDPARVTFLRDHLSAAQRAITDGADLRAFHAWSLLDNFEWARGYTQRWGLVHVDFDTQARTLKQSATWYRDVATQRSLPS